MHLGDDRIRRRARAAGRPSGCAAPRSGAQHRGSETGARRHRTLIALPAAFAIADVIGMIATSTGDAELPLGLGLPGLALTALTSGALLLRRRRPILLFALAVVVTPGAALFTHASAALILCAGYAIGAWSGRLALGGAVVAVVAVLTGFAIGGEEGALNGVAATAFVLLPPVVGYALRTRRLYVEEVEQRLESAELRREDRARQAVLSERNRIARELHDVVAHHVSLIGVRAGAARTSLATDPDAAEAALLAIEDSSRQAVAELRQLLGALRDGNDLAELGPQPGLRELDRLVDGYVAAGLDVRFAVDGPTDAVDPLNGLTVYRVVEEALTNVTRHSGAGHADVVVGIDDDELRVRVTDPGPARTEAAPIGTGSGLIGMRERVLLTGGAIEAGPSGEGFDVDATIPRRRA